MEDLLIYKKYGELFRDFRNKNNLSIKKLSIFSGVSKATISNFENGKSMMSFENLVSTLEVMNMTISDYTLAINNGIPDYFITQFNKIEQAYYDEDFNTLEEIYSKNFSISTQETYFISLSAKACHSILNEKLNTKVPALIFNEQEIRDIDDFISSLSLWGLFDLHVFVQVIDYVEMNIVWSKCVSFFHNGQLLDYFQNLKQYRVLVYNIIIKAIFLFIEYNEKSKATRLLSLLNSCLTDSEATMRIAINLLQGCLTYKFDDKDLGTKKIQDTLQILKKLGGDKFYNSLFKLLISLNYKIK